MAAFLKRGGPVLAIALVLPGVSAAESHYGSETRQYISALASYLVLDEDRDISRKGFGASLAYGRELGGRWWWESEVSGYELDTGSRGGSDFYQVAVTTGLSYALLGERERFTPFVIGQVGVLRNDVVPSRDDDVGLHWNLGLGLVTAPLFSNGLKLRMDARYMYDDFDGIRGTASEGKGGFGDWRFSLGVEQPLGYRKVTEVETLVERFVEEPDADGDGIPDSRDQCPHTLAGGRVDADGCLIGDQVIVLHNLLFEFDSDRLVSSTGPILDRMAAGLNSQSNIAIEIGGHTDAVGSDAYNLELSRRRAEAVRQALIMRGVDAERVRAEGFGKTVPLTDNDSESGRAMNRRVEFTVKAY